MNWSRWFGAVLFTFWENAYFGWHLFPKSDAELIADGIAVLLFSLSVGPTAGSHTEEE